MNGSNATMTFAEFLIANWRHVASIVIVGLMVVLASPILKAVPSIFGRLKSHLPQALGGSKLADPPDTVVALSEAINAYRDALNALGVGEAEQDRLVRAAVGIVDPPEAAKGGGG